MSFWTSWTSCNVVDPGNTFHSNSIGSPSNVSKVLHCDESLNHLNCCSQTVFDVGFWFIFPRHDTESENTKAFACERLMTSSSLTKDNCFYGELSLLLWDTPKISSDCSNINSSDISNISFKVRLSFVFLMEWNCLTDSFPWIQMLPLEDIKTHQITERV